MFKSIASEYPIHQALPLLLPTVLEFLWALSVLKTECTPFHKTSSSAHLSVGSHPSAHSFCLTNIEFTQLKNHQISPHPPCWPNYTFQSMMHFYFRTLPPVSLYIVYIYTFCCYLHIHHALTRYLLLDQKFPTNKGSACICFHLFFITDSGL